MKTVETNGGPLIAMARSQIEKWAGIDGARFVGEHTAFSNDYKAACYLTNGRNFPPCEAATITGPYAEAIVFTMPFETALVSNIENVIYLIQVEYSEETWSFDQIGKDLFDLLFFEANPQAIFNSIGGSYIAFDSAVPGDEIEDDYIEFHLSAGPHRCDVVSFAPDELTGLYIIKISAISS